MSVNVSDILLNNCKSVANSLETSGEALSRFAGLPRGPLSQGHAVGTSTSYAVATPVAMTLPGGSMTMPLRQLLWDPRAALQSFPLLQPPALGPIGPPALGPMMHQGTVLHPECRAQSQAVPLEPALHQQQKADVAATATADKVEQGLKRKRRKRRRAGKLGGDGTDGPADTQRPRTSAQGNTAQAVQPHKSTEHQPTHPPQQSAHLTGHGAAAGRVGAQHTDSTAATGMNSGAAAAPRPQPQAWDNQGPGQVLSQEGQHDGHNPLASSQGADAPAHGTQQRSVQAHAADVCNPRASQVEEAGTGQGAHRALVAPAQAQGLPNAPVPQEATIRSWPLSANHASTASGTSSYSTGSVKAHNRQLVDDAQGPPAPGPQEAIVIDSGVADEGETLTSDRLRVRTEEARKGIPESVRAASSGPALAAVSRASLLLQGHTTTNTTNTQAGGEAAEPAVKDERGSNAGRLREVVGPEATSPLHCTTREDSGQGAGHQRDIVQHAYAALPSEGVHVFERGPRHCGSHHTGAAHSPGHSGRPVADSAWQPGSREALSLGGLGGISEGPTGPLLQGPEGPPPSCKPAVAAMHAVEGTHSMLVSEGRSSPVDHALAADAALEADSPLLAVPEHAEQAPLPGLTNRAHTTGHDNAAHMKSMTIEDSAHCPDKGAVSSMQDKSMDLLHATPRNAEQPGTVAAGDVAAIAPSVPSSELQQLRKVQSAAAELDLDTCPLIDRVVHLALNRVTLGDLYDA